jgi:DNA-binding GntR family transcriptional regulator
MSKPPVVPQRPADRPADQTGVPLIGTSVLSGQVTDFLMGQIVNGNIRQGDRINEAELARRLGISRNPIREAVNRLEERGLLIAIPRRGHFVRSFSRKDIDDLFSFRSALESFALRQGLPGMDDRDLDALAGLVDEMESAAAAGDEARLTALDVSFHRRICELSGNGHTLHAFTTIEGEVQMLIAFVDYGFTSLHAAAADHWPVVEALRSRDPERAAGALQEHIRDAWSRIALDYPEPEQHAHTQGRVE